MSLWFLSKVPPAMEHEQYFSVILGDAKTEKCILDSPIVPKSNETTNCNLSILEWCLIHELVVSMGFSLNLLIYYLTMLFYLPFFRILLCHYLFIKQFFT